MKEFFCVLTLSLLFGAYNMVGASSDRAETEQKIQTQIVEIQKRFVEWGKLAEPREVKLLWHGHAGYSVIHLLSLPGTKSIVLIVIDPVAWAVSSALLREAMIAHEMGHTTNNCLEMWGKVPPLNVENCADIQTVQLLGFEHTVQALQQLRGAGQSRSRIMFLEYHRELIDKHEKK